MATTENAAGAEIGNQVVGTVIILYGNAKALSIDGTERILSPNSPIFSYDRVITESDGMVSIIIDDPAQSQIDIGRMSHIIIDEDIFAGVSAEDVAAAAAEVEQIQEALLAEGFDPTVELEAPAAGASPAAGGGHPVPDFARVTHEGEVASGAETTGIITDTVDPIDGVVEPVTPTISVEINAEGGSAQEGTPVTFEVSINTVSDADTTVTVNVFSDQGDTATAHVDYDASAAPGVETYTVVIPAGETNATFMVDTYEDGLSEGSETFSAQIIDATNTNAIINVDPASATGLILDNDAQPNVSIAVDAADAAGVTEGGTVNFIVTQDAISDSDTTVTVNLSDGSATAGDDYTDASPYTVTILAGQTTANLTVDVDTINDNADEPSPENFTATITSALNATGVGIGTASATGLILDNDAQPNVSIAVDAADAAGVTEGGTVNFIVTQDAISDSDTTVTVNLSDGSATAGDDYTDASPYTVTILAGQTTANLTVDVDTINDNADEPSPENFTATITSALNATGVGIGTASATGLILDNDAQPNVSIAVDAADAAGVTEGGTVNFIVTQDAISDSDTTVTVNLSDGSATAGDDYTDASPYTVTILAGQTTANLTVDVDTINDNADEPSPENFTATITSALNATGVGIGTASATGLILDNDAQPNVSIAVDAADAAGVTEGGTVNFIVTQDAISDSDTTVTVNLSDGSATAGDDYTDAGPYTVTILAGQTTANLTVDVDTINDNADEPSPENFTATITSALNATGVGIGTASATGLILDNDAQPNVSIAVDAADAAGVTEGGTVNFIVTQDAISDSDTTVTVNLSDGSATAGDDYTDASPYTVTILAGQTTANLTVDVDTINDNADEPSPENFTATITSALNATGVGIGTASATGLILDNDAQPNVSIAVDAADAAGVTEGGTVNFIVTQDAISDSDTTVTVNLSDGSATAGDDYTDASPYTVTILAGQTTANLTVDVDTINDNADEPSPENFTATITSALNATGVGIGTASATGLILDNDAQPNVSIAVDAADAAGVTEGGTVNFIVTQDAISDSDTTVTVNLSDGSATAGDDYTDASPYTVTILAGQTTANLTVDVDTINDNADEPSPENFTATITSALNATGVGIGTASATGLILDNDAQPNVSIAVDAADAAGVTEGGTVNFIVTQDAISDSDTTVTVNLSDGSATAGDDYTDASPYTVTILAGQTTANLTVDVDTINDNADEPSPENFTATITSALNATGVGIGTASATGLILDNDAQPNVSIAVDAADAAGVTEGGTVNFIVTQDAISDSDTTVTVNLSDGSATAGDDYTDASPYTVTILAGQTTANLTVDVDTINDNADEPSPENFTATITSALNATGVGIGTASATGLILDNDAQPNVSIAVDAADAAGVTEGGTVNFIVTQDAISDSDTTVTVNLSDGSATAGDDYTDASPYTVTILAGQTTANLTVDVDTINDNADEPSPENFTATITSALNTTGVGIGTASATGLILDNDAQPNVSIAVDAADAAGVTEGGTVNFIVTQDAISDSDTTVTVNLSDGSATAGDDYTDASPYTVTILAGQTTANLTVDVDTINDNADEPSPENFTATITSALNATGVGIGTASATGLILDNDAQPNVSIAVDAADAAGVTEGGTVNFIVTQDAISDSDTTVTVNLSDGSATAGDDYTDASPYTVTILAGQTTANLTVDVDTINDNADEPSPENFTATITSALNATGVGIGTASATGLILDNDAQPNVSIAVDAADAAGVTEGGTVNFIVTQDAISDSDTTVTVNLSDGSATAGDDYTDASPYTVTILAGQTTANLTVDVDTINDNADEPSPENFTATITSALNATGVGIGTASATGLILDNDAQPNVSIAVDAADAAGVTEGGTVNFIVTQDAISDSDTTVTVNLSDGSATAGDDYTDASPYTVTILAGQTTANLTVDVDTINDNADEPSPENFTATITSALNATGVGIGTASATGLILDNDAQPNVSIAVDAADAAGVTEGGTVNFIVTQDAISDSDTTVTVNLSDGSATAGDDYTDAGPYTVTILAGQTTANLTVDVDTINDNADEPSPENFTATITSALNATGVGIGTASATGLILDNDAQPNVSIAVDAADAAGVTEGGTVNFIVTQDAISDSDTTVTVNLSDGSATAGDDYTDASPYTVTILAGQTTANLTVDVDTINDNADEPSPENFTATITSALNTTGVGIGTASATGLILDNDAQPNVSIAVDAADAAGVTEGGTVNFIVTQDAISDSDTTVTVNLSDGSATAGDDYTDASPYTVTILAGQTTANLTVDVDTINDNADEPSPENFTATITSALNATGVGIGTASATGLILDNDAQPNVSIAVDAADAAGVTEGGTVNFIVTQDAISDSDTTVTVNLSDGSATAGDDYTDASPYTVTILAGQTTANLTVDVDTINDNADEPSPENFTATITSALNTTGVGIGTASATGEILDNDTTPEVGMSTATVSEEGLPGGNPDSDGSPSDISNSDTFTGTILVTDADGDSLTVTLEDPPVDGSLTSNGVDIIWSGQDTNTLTGKAGTDTVITISIDNNGNYAVDIDGPIDHQTVDVEDVESFNVTVRASDGFQSSTGTLTVDIEDDSPTFTNIDHGIIANEPGILIGTHDIAIGADQPGSLNVTPLTNIDGVNYGNPVYNSDGSVELTASTISGDFFTLTVKTDGTYDFNLINERPSVQQQFSLLNVTGGGRVESFALGDATFNAVDFNGNNSIGNEEKLNSASVGFGVGSGNLDPGEQFAIDFSDGVVVDSLTFHAKHEGSKPFVLQWSTDTGETESVTIVDDGFITIDPHGDFNSIDFEILGGKAKFDNFSYNKLILADDESLQFNIQATDADHDTASQTLSITLLGEEPAGTLIEGTSGNDAVKGTSSSETIEGHEGDDYLQGGAGDDTLDGGTGDDTLTGGDGADTFKVAEGDDTITDYNQAEGDIVDISDMFESVDTLAVSENPDGSVKLSVIDGSHDEKGSVSFENIEFASLDSDPGVDLNGDGDMNELDSLLGQVDIDDGII